MAQTWWVAGQDRARGVAYIVVSSGNDQFPSGDAPSIYWAAGPFTSQADAQTIAGLLNAAPGASLGVKSPGGSQVWFYNSHSGQVIESTSPITEWIEVLRTKTGTGWHQFASQADMLAAIAANHWPAPQYSNGIAANLKNAPKIAAGTAAAATGGVAGFLAGLESKATWIRVIEVVAGGTLLIIGLNKMSNGKIAAAVRGTAKTAGKVIP